MESKNIKNEEEKSKESNKTKDQFRVVLNSEANNSLELMTNKVNDNFFCGKITKSDVANMLLIKLNGSISPADIKELQELHFDEKKMLSDLLRGSTENNDDIPTEISRALKEHFGFSSRATKSSKKMKKKTSEPF